MKRIFQAAAFFVIFAAILFPDEVFSGGNAAQPCTNGFSGNQYPCSRVLLQSQIALNEFSSRPSAASNLWGYVDPDDHREYALIGLSNGTAVVEVTDPVIPRVVGIIEGLESAWREVKAFSVYNDKTKKWDGYAYVVTETTDGGLQIINLSNLPNKVNQVRVDSEISTAHTLLISNVDWATGVPVSGLKPYLYVMGANRLQFQKPNHGEPGAGRGLTVFNLTNPKNPKIIGSYSDTYVHDIYVETLTDKRAEQCVEDHNPCEVVFAYTGKDGFRIIDFTDKKHPAVLSSLYYPGLAYAHSGWISRNKRWLFSFDEIDEMNSALNTTVRSINIANLRNPQAKVVWIGDSRAIDHNGFVVGNKLYMSHYTKGLAVFNAKNPTKLIVTGTFDTHPENDITDFAGAWGVYPFLPSGNILISDMQRGLFVLKEQPGQ